MRKFHTPTVEEAVEVRKVALAYAMSIAMESPSALTNGRLLTTAKEFETFLWGGFAPVEAPPTQLATIEEAIDFLFGRLSELTNNVPSMTAKKEALEECLSLLNRLVSDITAALAK